MTQRVFVQHLDPFAMEFIDALCLTDKRVTRVEWLWRYNLMTGTVMLAMTDIRAQESHGRSVRWASGCVAC